MLHGYVGVLLDNRLPVSSSYLPNLRIGVSLNPPNSHLLRQGEFGPFTHSHRSENKGMTGG